MTKRSLRTRLTSKIQARVPGYAIRVRRQGLLRGTLQTIDPRRLSGYRKQVEAVEALARRMRVKPALTVATQLRKSGESDLALVMINELLVRYPRSSEVLLERGKARLAARDARAREDFLAAGRGDLKSVSLGTVVGVAAIDPDTFDKDEWVGLVQGIYADEKISSHEHEVTLRAIELISNAHSGVALEVTDADIGLPIQILASLVEISRNHLQWLSITRLCDLIEQHATNSAMGVVRLALARALRVKGDLSRSISILEPILNVQGNKDAARLAAMSESDLKLLRSGWRPSEASSRVKAAPGRVGYLLYNSLPHNSNGYATRTQGLLSGLVRRGWRADAVTRPGYPMDRSEFAHLDRKFLAQNGTIDGVNYQRITKKSPDPSLEGRVDHFADQLAKLFDESRWGVVHAASNHYVGMAAVEAGARLGIPSIFEVRGMWDVTRASRETEYFDTERFDLAVQMEADACRGADHAFAITEGLRNYMIERGVPKDHISLLPNGVDINRFTPSAPDAALRTRLGLDGKTVIGYVGSVVDYEGLELLVDAVKVLIDDMQPVALLVVGDGMAFDSVKRRVEAAGISEHVVLPGRVPHAEAEAYYSIIDIAPFPRLPLPVTELVSPLKPFEAMAMAKPVVVSSVAALTEIVTDGENGLVFTKGDVNSLAATLSRLVDSKEERDQLGAAGRDWVVANRSWDALSARIVEVYEKLGVPFPAK